MAFARDGDVVQTVVVGAQPTTCRDVVDVARRGAIVHLDPTARARVSASFAALAQLVDDGADMYGLTTGVGALDGCRIAGDTHQAQLIRSHAAGVGAPLAADVVRAMMFCRVSDLAAGDSGIQPRTLNALVSLLNRNVVPVVPEISSVGASDLSALAHVALLLIADDQPALGFRDGLALINGLSLSEGAAALAVVDASAVCATAELACSMSMLGLGSSTTSLSPRLDKLLSGSRRSAERMRTLVGDLKARSKLREHLSTRSAHHVIGAARDAVGHAQSIVEAELAQCIDNPVVRADGWHTSNSGNCDGQSLAHAMDYLAATIVSLATGSERRIARLLDSNHSGLPAFLIASSVAAGQNSGLMIAQYTAAAIVAELRTTTAAGNHSIPTCAGTEDHVSMSALAARSALRKVQLVNKVLAIELLCAAQAVDLRGSALTAPLARLHDRIRAVVPFMECDRVVADDVASVLSQMRSGALADDL